MQKNGKKAEVLNSEQRHVPLTAEQTEALAALPEKYLQKLIRQLFAQVGRRWLTVCKSNLEIIACGEWNFDAGPDFSQAAVVIGGEIVCGDIEVHIRASDWRRHGHQRDARYADVLLHAVLENDSAETFGRYTLVLPSDELYALWQADLRNRKRTRPNDHDVVESLQVLQDYAIRRLERKISYARELLDLFDLEAALARMLKMYMQSFLRRKRRPSSGERSVERWQQAVLQSAIPRMLRLLQEQRLREDIGDCMQKIAQTRILDEGEGLRSEILINVVLPMVLQISGSEQRRRALEWYWALPTTQFYGRLRRVFRQLPQDTVWQQQGMLEYFHEIRSGRQRVCDLMFRYNADAHQESRRIYFSGDVPAVEAQVSLRNKCQSGIADAALQAGRGTLSGTQTCNAQLETGRVAA